MLLSLRCFNLAFLAVLAVAPTVATAEPIATVDQEQTSSSFNANIDLFTPIGQGFTPTLAGLDAVDLRLIDAGDVFVRIRDGGIDGSILGTSLTNSLPGDGFGILHFDFPSTVPLTPGNLYVIEVVLPVFDNVHWVGQSGNPYAGGTAFLDGGALPSDDFWFREGLHAVPEPNGIVLFGIGTAALVAGGLRHRLCRRTCSTHAATNC